MKAAELVAHYRIEFKDMPEPVPQPNEVKIRVYSAGICGSELHAYKGTHPFRHPPAILGHEMAGEIVAVGAEVKGYKVGDRVTVNPQRNCDVCDYCRSGHANLCINKTMLGTLNWVGAYAEYMVAPEHVLFKIPDHMSYDEAVMIEPVTVAVHAVREAGLKVGESLLILGGGTIGLGTLAVARAAGIMTTIVTDAVDYNLSVARELGATATVNVRKDDLKAVVDEVSGGKGMDVAIVTVGLSAVVNQALVSTKKRGRIVVIALFEKPITIENPFLLVGGERVMRGSQIYNHVDFQTALDLIASGRIDARMFVTQRLPMREIQRGFEIVDKKTEDCVKVVLNW